MLKQRVYHGVMVVALTAVTVALLMNGRGESRRVLADSGASSSSSSYDPVLCYWSNGEKTCSLKSGVDLTSNNIRVIAAYPNFIACRNCLTSNVVTSTYGACYLGTPHFFPETGYECKPNTTEEECRGLAEPLREWFWQRGAACPPNPKTTPNDCEAQGFRILSAEEHIDAPVGASDLQSAKDKCLQELALRAQQQSPFCVGDKCKIDSADVVYYRYDYDKGMEGGDDSAFIVCKKVITCVAK